MGTLRPVSAPKRAVSRESSRAPRAASRSSSASPACELDSSRTRTRSPMRDSVFFAARRQSACSAGGSAERAA